MNNKPPAPGEGRLFGVEYEIQFRIDMGKAIPAVGELVDSVNAELASFGYSERLKCHAPCPFMVLTVDRELNEEELYKMKVMLEAEVIQAFPKCDVRLVSFRRKSGNVSQSVIQ